MCVVLFPHAHVAFIEETVWTNSTYQTRSQVCIVAECMNVSLPISLPSFLGFAYFVLTEVRRMICFWPSCAWGEQRVMSASSGWRASRWLGANFRCRVVSLVVRDCWLPAKAGTLPPCGVRRSHVNGSLGMRAHVVLILIQLDQSRLASDSKESDLLPLSHCHPCSNRLERID